jgi:hypothetical protein
VVEQPGDLAGREVGVEQQPGLALHELARAALGQRRAGGSGAAVLPDDRRVHGPTRRLLPQHDGLALVGQTQREQAARVDAGVVDRLPADRLRRAPDLLGVVLDPALAREGLPQRELRRAERAQARVEDDRTRARGALVERQQAAIGPGDRGHGRPAERGGAPSRGPSAGQGGPPCGWAPGMRRSLAPHRPKTSDRAPTDKAEPWAGA